jgi:mannose-6-phosphate isomerase-like protein (cupin superfamily)
VTPTLQLLNRHTGEWLHLHRGYEGDREVLYLHGGVPPGGEGPPMHVHVDQDETGEVVSGRLSASVGGKTLTFGPGEQATFPRGVPHRWWNAGDEPVVFRGKAVPAGDLDQFLHGIFDIVNASANGRPSLFHVAHLSLRHPGQRVSPAPAWVDRIVLRIVVAVGRMVGAYPAGGWPGAPQSTTKAPMATRLAGTPHATLA